MAEADSFLLRVNNTGAPKAQRFLHTSPNQQTPTRTSRTRASSLTTRLAAASTQGADRATQERHQGRTRSMPAVLAAVVAGRKQELQELDEQKMNVDYR